MNHYSIWFSTVREKSTGEEGNVIAIDKRLGSLEVQFPNGVKWLKENEIEVMEEQIMEFDKSKVYTAVNAYDLKVGSKVIVADKLSVLKQRVLRNEQPKELLEVLDEDHTYRFVVLDGEVSALAYLVPEPAKLKWTDLKIGDVIKNGSTTAMVTAISSEKKDIHILAGDVWFYDRDLKYWSKE